MWARRSAAVAIAVLLGLVACGSGDDVAAPAAPDDSITIGSFDFPESDLLARLYGAALGDAGFDVDLQLGLGPRELVTPALHQGLLDLVPEYLGAALLFLSLGATDGGPETGEAVRALEEELAGGPLLALEPAPAQDANAFVVTAETAARHGLERLSDLRRLDGELTLAGPPECPTRQLCLAGLERVYGLRFRTFVPLDAGGPLSLQALEGGQVDVALLFSTDPALDGDDLVALDDDRTLQPAENVIPLLRRDVVERHGEAVVGVLDGVSEDLTTADLRALNAELREGRAVDDVVREWLERHGDG